MTDLPEGYPPPEEAGGWRPGQAGALLLGGTRPEHIVATLVDLAQRGHVQIDAIGDTDWRLTKLPVQPDHLLRYERQLLRALFDGARTMLLARLPTTRYEAVGRVHTLLTRDVMLSGEIRPSLSVTDDGPHRHRLRVFRDRLRDVPQAWLDQPAYLPYAIAFGLAPLWAPYVQGTGGLGVFVSADADWLTAVLGRSW